ncbi:Isopullulanase [Auriculariales sp. MPI-PUGE-AT-0066]|nr:Isopullulanase [Auriculariales sp. MPI-PUGE-AT-0066]
MLALFALLILPTTLVAGVTVANTTQLQTWSHNNAVASATARLANNAVRQSHRYSVQVQATGDATFYDSFVYLTVPRNGMGKTSDPNNPNAGQPLNDGIFIEPYVNNGMSMAWTQFMYATNVTVKVHRTDGKAVNLSSVTIRPTTLGYNLRVDGSGDLLISIPYSTRGTRFSVEFADDLYTFRNGDSGPSSYFVQTDNPNGDSYVSNFTNDMPVMATEPTNALLIFASPFETADLVPNMSDQSTYIVRDSAIDYTFLRNFTSRTLYFPPGVYYCGSTAQLELSSSFDWVYFSPGSYVKCSILFGNPGAHHGATSFKATGHGVLSGEQYVFKATPAEGFRSRTTDAEPVRMWRGTAHDTISQQFVLNGVTVNSPPFNSMDFTGNLNNLACIVNDYKQVGAYFGETDGLQNYPGSRVADVFYHSGDDTIKTYYSNVTIERITVWKGNTAPVIEFGWHSYDIHNILVNQVDVIYARWNREDSFGAIVGARSDFSNLNATDTANIQNAARDITFSNLRVEGYGAALFRVCPLETYSNITISNIWIEKQPPAASGTTTSTFKYFTDKNHGNSGVGVTNFMVSGFTVGTDRITSIDNTQFNIAAEYKHGNIIVS